MDDREKDFVKMIESIASAWSPWQVWSDMVYMFAATLSNSVDARHREAREDAYMRIIGKYKREEQLRFAELFAALAEALEADQDSDFLGKIFMLLELSNHWKGQFFTPMSVCRCMAGMQMADMKDLIRDRGWVSINDCCCGAGALLIAAAAEARNQGIAYHDHLLFVAQDIDQTAALMCYIQLSLLGCAGYVKIADSLRYPMTGGVLEPGPGDDIWITPLFFSDTWTYRRLFHRMDALFTEPGQRPEGLPPSVSPERQPPPEGIPESTAKPVESTKKPQKPVQLTFL